MRWPLNHPQTPIREDTYAEIEALLLGGDEASLAKAREQLLAAIGDNTEEPEAVITEVGPETAERKALFIRQIDLSYEHALLYAATGEEEHARRAAAIMVRFGEVMPKWRLIDREGEIHTQDDKAYLRRWNSNGFWKWYPLDLAVTMPMLRAYDMIRPALAAEEQKMICDTLFFYHKDFLDRFSSDRVFYTNLAGYHLLPSIRVGQVLERPDYIEQVISYWRDFMKYSYSADGFFREVTPDYHNQITGRVVNTLPEMLKTVSESSGLSLPDLGTENAAQFRQVEAGLEVLALPDGTLANTNDSWPKRGRSRKAGEAARPGLLGISGVAKLGMPGMTAMLQFGGIRGHDHHDALNIIWFAAGKELFSDTGYQPIKGSGSSRRWHTISASHNTVVVNEETQFEGRDAYALPHRIGAFAARPPTEEESRGKKAPIEAANPAAAGFYNQGRLLVWDGDSPLAQAMEAEQERAYGGVTSLYRRTVLMVSIDGDEGYLVDLFRVNGGHTHDYMLRPGLDEAATIEFDRPLEPLEGVVHESISLKGRATVKLPFTAEMAFPSNGPRVHSTLVELFPAKAGATVELLSGEAPAIRRTGVAPFSFIRHATKNKQGLESSFVWVHEATRGAQRIRKTEAKQVGNSIVLKVHLDDRVDTIISALEPESQVRTEDLSFNGKLAFLSEKEGQVAARIHHGTLLQKGGQTIAEALPSLKGEIVETHAETLGDATHSLLVRPVERRAQYPSHLAHIDLGDAIRFSVPITQVTERQDGLLQVDLAHEPGFLRQEREIIMTRFPGWRIQALPMVSLE